MITILISFLFFLLASSDAQAQIIINEVFPAPEQGNEWIELYNPSDQEIDLTNWLLEDLLSSPSVIAIIENQALSPQDYLVIELSSAKLNNSADSVILKNSVAEIIDQMSYEKSETDWSWSRNNAGIFELTQPTKNISNIFPNPSPTITPLPTPSPSPTDTSFHEFITISEFLACPGNGEKEWLKLYNSDSQPHSISNWKIRDISNQTRLLNTSIAAEAAQIIYWSGSLLNNSGDEFNLENELGENLQDIKYDACQTDVPILTSSISSSPTPLPHTADTPTLPAKLTPPNPPTLPNSPQRLILSYDSTASSVPNKKVTLTVKKPPKTAILSVILGGSCLVFSSSWKIHEKISSRPPAT
jgi:hypothetical protein